jgi:hypothetical protein
VSVLSATTELGTIRALSQYRPFEAGGESVRDAYEDLILAALAEADGGCEAIEDLHSTIFTLFRIDLELLSIAGTLNQLKTDGKVLQEGQSFVMSEAEQERLAGVAAESEEVSRQALDDWRDFVHAHATVTVDEFERMEEDLTVFLKTVLRRHGIEATLLLYPEAEEAQGIYASIEAEGFGFLTSTPPKLQDIRDASLSEFIRHPTEAQRAYLAQNLNTAYFLSVLSIDPDGARLLAEIAAGQRVYFDTNFLYRLLGVQGPRYVKPAEAIISVTQKAGYDCCITPWTLDEFRESLRRSRDFLQKYPVPPGDYARIAASATGEENFVTAYWKEVRSGVKLADFFEYYAEIETHLKNHGIRVENEGCVAVGQLENDIQDQVAILERTTHGRFRHPALLEHDVKHRLLVQRLREQASATTFSNAGYWFLTHDSVLPRYDYYASPKGTLPFCVSAGAWFQIMEAFRPKTEDPEQSLADMLASPYVRYRRTLSLRSASEVVARVDKFKGGTPELAARVLMNTASLEEIEVAGTDEERLEKIDNAIIVAAREAQEHARRAREIADKERALAAEVAAAAKARADELERQALLAVAVEQETHKSQLANERARAEEALKDQGRRAKQDLEDERRRHKAELLKRDNELATTSREAQNARKRLLFGGAFVVAVVVFLLLDLAVGLRSAWAVLGAAAVLFGLGMGISQWARWKSGL